MKIFTVNFDVDKCKTFSRLLDVFRESLKIHMPDVELVEHVMQAPESTHNRPKNTTFNTAKLAVWMEYLHSVDDEIIFIDSDMLCLQSGYHAFDSDFDYALTFRPEGSQPPMNGGVVFTRPTKKARRFFRDWFNVNNDMYANPPFHHKWRAKYLGMNQAAFGYMYESGLLDSGFKKLPTVIWNAVDQDWKSINDKTVFVHIKSQLRRAIMYNHEPYGEYTKPMDEWYRINDYLHGGIPIVKDDRPPSTMNPETGRKKRAFIVKKAKQRGRVL
jgi:hypothetical protein